MPKKNPREGYTVTEQQATDLFGREGQTTFSIIRDSDGTGLGAYATEEDVDRVIEHDRSVQASAEKAFRSEGEMEYIMHDVVWSFAGATVGGTLGAFLGTFCRRRRGRKHPRT